MIPILCTISYTYYYGAVGALCSGVVLCAYYAFDLPQEPLEEISLVELVLSEEWEGSPKPGGESS